MRSSHLYRTEGPHVTQSVRLAVAAVALGSLFCGLLGYAAGIEWLRATGFIIFMFFGLGAALVQHSRLELPGYVAIGLLSGLVVLILVSWGMVELPYWHPALAFGAASIAAFYSHWLVIRDRNRVSTAAPEGKVLVTAGGGGDSIVLPALERPARRRPKIHWTPSIICSGLGTLLWVSSALASRPINPGVGGYLTQIAWTWYLGPLLLAAGLVLAKKGEHELEAAIAVTLLAMCFTVTVSLVYNGLRSDPAARHVGVIEQILADHRVHSSFDIYNAWPGFFSMMAWITDISGIKDPMSVARWWPTLMGLFRLGEFRYLAGKILGRGYRCWLAAGLVVLADTISADYFSPQAVGYVLALGIYAVAFTRPRETHRYVRLGLLLAAGVAIAVTHQLSPYMCGATLVVLVIFGLVKPWWTPALILVPAVLWAAINHRWLSQFIHLNDIGVAGNFSPPRQKGVAGLHRLPVVFLSEAGLAVGVGILSVAGLAYLWRNRRSKMAWGLGFCVVAPLSSVAANAYGNEGIYRAALFAIPWLALMAAGWTGWAYRRYLTVLPIALVVLLTTYLNGTATLDGNNVMRTTDRDALRLFENTGFPGSWFLFNGGGDLPVGPTDRAYLYNTASYFNLDKKDPTFNLGPNPSRSLAALTVKYLRFTHLPVGYQYYLVSPSTRIYNVEYALQTYNQFDAITRELFASGYWKAVYDKGGTVLFRLVAEPSVVSDGYTYRLIVGADGETVGELVALTYGDSPAALPVLDHYNPWLGHSLNRKISGRLVEIPSGPGAPILSLKGIA